MYVSFVNCSLFIKCKGLLCGNPTDRGESLIFGRQVVYNSSPGTWIACRKRGASGQESTIYQVLTLPNFVWISDSGDERLQFERGEKTPTPKIPALLRKRPVSQRANFVLTKDRKRPYYRRFCGQMHRKGSCSKAAGCP